MFKKLLIVSLVIVFALPAFALPTFADNENKNGNKIKNTDMNNLFFEDLERVKLQPKPLLFIGPNGKLRIHSGVITSISGNQQISSSNNDSASAVTIPTQIVVKVWGHSFTIDTTGVKVFPSNQQPHLAINNTVSIEGTITDAGVIKANKIHDHTAAKNTETSATVRRINELLKLINELRAKIGLAPITA